MRRSQVRDQVVGDRRMRSRAQNSSEVKRKSRMILRDIYQAEESKGINHNCD